jgi:hypothetical protein
MTDGKEFYEVRNAGPAGFVVSEYDLVEDTAFFFFTKIGGRRRRISKSRLVFRDKERALRECYRRNGEERQKRLDEIAHIDTTRAEIAKQIDELTRKENE